jgi:murein DD-endopeptidase MepM/ murein hydrolase activator NlpD
MSKVGPRPVNAFVRRRPARKIIIANGDTARTIVLRPWLTASLTTVGLAFFALYLAATGYLVFRDDLLAASIARQARIQHAYEDRIATLRADIDRLTSRQLLNQQAFEEKLEKLLGRQAALDARQDIIAGLSQAAKRAGLTPAGGSPPTPVPNPLPSEAATGGPLITGSLGTLRSGERAPLAIAMLRPSRDKEPDTAAPANRISDVEDSLDELAHEQVAYVERVAGKVGEHAGRIWAVLKKLGHKVPATAGNDSAVGGPFVPLAANADPETFRNNVQVITAELDRLAEARNLASQLPLAKPVTNAAVTSRFGTRLDPFLRRPALHTGVDFRAAKGYPVRSTAGGKVVIAEYNGGYGKMVEIDHGNGVTTRYGHLSRISVKAGDTVAKGALVGRAGSTGRSTGLDGEPIDPMRYIRAGTEINSLL